MRILFFIISFFIFSSNCTFALDIVYPSAKELTKNANSTFFIGNTNPNATLKINSESVKLWDEGVFVQIVPLYSGENIIKIESTLQGKTETKIFKITRPKFQPAKSAPIPFIEKEAGTYLYTKTINNRSTVREKPSSSGKRIIDLPKGVILYLSGIQGDYYKIEESGKTEFWIHKSNIQEPCIVTKRIPATIKSIGEKSDKLYNYTKMTISHPVMYTIEQENKKLILTLYGTQKEEDNNQESKNAEFIFEDKNPVVGYDGEYKDDKFILRRARVADKVNIYKPLHGVRIFVDAGHGGSEKGSVGPTRVCEKDVNLAITKNLVKLLQEEGAIVSFSRLEDKNINLYDRIKIAKDNNAYISLSIHSNALPDGKNPYTDHGTEVHYYNDNAKVLANIIKNNLANDLNLRDNGIRKSSFAMTRETNPISVLIEVAYMINPEEYKKLKDANFQEKAAESIKKSLEEFMILLKK